MNKNKNRKSRLTILSTYSEIINGRSIRKAIAKCECGVVKSYWLGSITTKHTLSCGCAFKGINSTHGLQKHPLYSVWQNMRKRCNNPKAKRYDRYGGRGIIVCKSWDNSFLRFYNWAIKNGWQKGLTIDRKNNDKNYFPSNCRFVTQKNNCRNQSRTKRFNYYGRMVTAMELSEESGIKAGTIFYRLTHKWPLNKILLPVKTYKK